MAKQFDPGDHVTAKCHACNIEVTESLTGEYDERIYDEAVEKVSAWMLAHMQQFHPDEAGASHIEGQWHV